MSTTSVDPVIVKLAGRILVGRVDELRAEFKAAEATAAVEIDLSMVEAMDTAGAWLIVDL